MFGIGGSEILVILIVALLFLGPDKLPDAAKQISKGIRDIKKQSRALQQTIENDEHIGGAIRDLKSALRGEELPVQPRPAVAPQPSQESLAAGEAVADADTDVTHPIEDPHHFITEPRFVGEAGEVSVADSDTEPVVIKPPAGETTARSTTEPNQDATKHKHG